MYSDNVPLRAEDITCSPPGSPSSAATHALFEDLRTARRGRSGPLTTIGKTLGRGELVGRYVILDTLGRGGMGVVYLAYDPELDRKVALKLLLPGRETLNDAARARLLREAKALARLAHPNVVAIHDVGAHEEQMWIAMELVNGRTLERWASERPRPWPEILQVLLHVASGVAAAHAVGLAHRDLKPDNVMIGDDGRVRVMDFGLAHLDSGLNPDTGLEPSCRGLVALEHRHAQVVTDLYTRVGTPAYMSPEQWRGHEAGASADQFGWCVVAWELLYGERPFAATNMSDLAAQVLEGRRRPPPRGRRIPGWLRRILERGLAPEPTQRWPSMTALLGEIGRSRVRARLRSAAIGVAGVAAIAGCVALGQRLDLAQRASRCEAEAAAITDVWRPERAQELRATFAATGVGYAQDTADRLIPWLDRQAADWRVASEVACRSGDAGLGGEWNADTRERARWCLDDQRLALESLVAEFERADVEVVKKAIPAVKHLSKAGRCVAPEVLQYLPAPPPELTATLQQVRTDLSRAYSLELAGKYAQGLAIATSARERAEHEVGWAPLVIAARLREGRLLGSTDALPASEEALTAAYFEAARLGAWDLATDAATQLIWTVGVELGRHAEGLTWFRHAEAMSSHGGEADELRAADRMHLLAHTRQAMGDYAEAKTLHEQALAIRERLLGPEHPDIVKSLSGLGNVAYRTGDYASAQAFYERALELNDRSLGPGHPTAATQLTRLGHVAMSRGDYKQALALHERALAIEEEVLGPDHSQIASSMQSLGGVHFYLGNYEEARRLYAQALALEERALGPEHPKIAANLYNLSNALQALSKYPEAISLLTRSLAISEKSVGPEHHDIAMSLSSMAEAKRALGAHSEARELLHRARKITEKTLGPTHIEMAAILTNLGASHADTREYAAARRYYDDALKIAEKAVGPDHSTVAQILENLGNTELGLARYAEARAFYERARGINSAALGPDHVTVADNLTGIARAYLGMGDANASREHAERALAIYAPHHEQPHGAALANLTLAEALVAAREDLSLALAAATRARDIFREHERTADVDAVERWITKSTARRR